MPAIRALEEETSQLAAQISQLAAQHKTLTEQTRAVKVRLCSPDVSPPHLAFLCLTDCAAVSNTQASLSEHNDALATDKFTLLNEQQACDKLKSQIVKSPERLKKELGVMGETAEVNKSEVDDLVAKLRELQSNHHTLNLANEKLQEQNDLAKDCMDEISKAKQLQKDMKENMSIIGNNEEQIQEHCECAAACALRLPPRLR